MGERGLQAREHLSGHTVAQRSLLSAWVGSCRLVFDLRALLAIEKQQIESERIVGPVDMRAWLDVYPQVPAGEAILIPSRGVVYRVMVCKLSHLVRSDLRQVFPIPRLLRPLTDRLQLKGVVALEDGLAFLVDPQRLVEAAWRAQGGAGGEAS